MKRLLLITLFAVAAALTVASAVTQIRPGERGVVRRFGKIIDTPGPGLYFGLPWGLDRVDRVPVEEVRRITVGFDPRDTEDAPITTDRVADGQLLTGDHNLINLQVEIYYKVNDEEVSRFVLQMDRAEALLARVTETALAEWVAGRNVDDVLLGGKAELPLWLVPEVNRRIRSRDYELGVHVEGASINYLNPPAEVKSAFEDVSRAETEIRTKIYKAEQQAYSRRLDADAQVFRSQRQSQAYAREQHLQARADAENFLKRLEQYRTLRGRNPYYLAGIWWDEMSRLYSRMRQTGRLDLLDQHLGANGLDITQVPLLPKKR
jgi:membrane protease subunit HflK